MKTSWFARRSSLTASLTWVYSPPSPISRRRS
jgi:hypothetical protein